MQKPNYTFKLYTIVVLFLLSIGGINAMPDGSISASDTSICQNNNVNLIFTTPSGTGDYHIVVNGTTYNDVSSGDTLIISLGSFVGDTIFNLDTIHLVVGGVISLTNSMPSSSVTITVNPPPIAGIIMGDDSICIGESTIINSSAMGDATPFVYNWMIGAGNLSGISSVDNIVLTGVSAGSEMVGYTVIDTNGCVSLPSPPLSVTINDLPTIGAVTGTSALCLGEMITLKGSTTSTATPITYNWSIGTGNLSGTSSVDSIVLTGVSPGSDNISYTVTDNNGCISAASAAFMVTITDLPTPSISTIENSGIMSNDTIICTGDSISLDPGNYSTYNWNVNNNTSQILTINPTTTTTYTVTVTDNNNCVATANTTIIVHPIPSIEVIDAPSSVRTNEDFQINITPSIISSTYIWNVTENNVTGATTGTIMVDEITENLTLENSRTGGLVKYSIGIEAEGCVGDNSDFSVSVLNLKTEEILSIPNTFSPNGDRLNETWRITLLDGNENPNDYTVTIFNRSGAIVYQSTISTPWDGGNSPDGAYLYIIRDSNDEVIKKATVTLIR